MKHQAHNDNLKEKKNYLVSMLGKRIKHNKKFDNRKNKISIKRK